MVEMADGEGDEGRWGHAAEPLSKLTLWSQMLKSGPGRTRLTSLVEGTQHLCVGVPKWTTLFLVSVKNACLY
jgi:hypothetical protein